MPQWQSYRHSTYIVITTYSYNQFLLDYLLLWGHTIKRRWIFICAKKKSLFMDTISKLLFILVTYSMSPFCKVFSFVGLLLLLLPSVFLSRSFSPDARDPCRNCDVNQDLNNLSTNIDFDHFEKGDIFCEFYLREGVKYCLAYFLRQRGTLSPLAKNWLP